MSEEEAVNIFKNYIYIFRDVAESKYSSYVDKEEAKDYIEMSEEIIKRIEKQKSQIDKDTLTVAYMAGYYTKVIQEKDEEYENKIYGKI